jgi:hypothetical protein
VDSPFPGMDPYLENPAYWADFHLTFIGCWREAIADVLPEPYEARLDETLLVQTNPGRTLQRGGGTVVMKPIVIPYRTLERVRQGRIQILHRADRSLVGVLEMLSPANKTGEGFADYCAKRQAILQRNAHLVELDLLLGGRRLPLANPLPVGDYHVLISRVDGRPNCEVYSWPLRQSLPTIPIPLRVPDPDVVVDLQEVFRQTYQRGRYSRSLRYGQPPTVLLSEKDKRWAMGRKAR